VLVPLLRQVPTVMIFGSRITPALSLEEVSGLVLTLARHLALSFSLQEQALNIGLVALSSFWQHTIAMALSVKR